MNSRQFPQYFEVVPFGRTHAIPKIYPVKWSPSIFGWQLYIRDYVFSDMGSSSDKELPLAEFLQRLCGEVLFLCLDTFSCPTGYSTNILQDDGRQMEPVPLGWPPYSFYLYDQVMSS